MQFKTDLVAVVIAPVRPHVEVDIVLLQAGVNGVGLVERGAERLLGIDRLGAVLGCVDDDGRAVLRLRADADDLWSLLLEHFLVVGTQVVKVDERHCFRTRKPAFPCGAALPCSRRTGGRGSLRSACLCRKGGGGGRLLWTPSLPSV